MSGAPMGVRLLYRCTVLRAEYCYCIDVGYSEGSQVTVGCFEGSKVNARGRGAVDYWSTVRVLYGRYFTVKYTVHQQGM